MRAIDADELNKFPIRIDHYDKEHGDEKYVFGVEAVLEYAENLPTIDLEELRPKGECAICDAKDNGFVVLNKTRGYSGIEIAANRQGMLRVRYYGNKDNFETQDLIQIARCPNCGAKMKKKI